MFRCVLLGLLTAQAVAFSFNPSLVAPKAGAFTPGVDSPLAAARVKLSARSRPLRATQVVMAESGLKRVVVTGMGITSPLGNSVDEVYESLYNAKSGIYLNEKFAELGFRSHVSGFPKMTEEEFKEKIPRQQLRFMSQAAKYAYVAMVDAIADAGLKPEDYEENPRCAAILGHAGGSIPDVMGAVDPVRDNAARWPNKVGPYRVTRVMGSGVSACLATAFKVRGPSYSVSSACSTGAHCIGTAVEQIQLGKCDMAFAGAGENEGWETAAMFDSMGALSTIKDEPTKASRAFDNSRAGFVISSGGGVVVLEEYERAKARGAKIYAEVTGYGANCDGYDMVAPSGYGGENCMKIAMEQADKIGGEKPVDYINTHGTSTPVGDAAELKAIARRFEGMGYQPNVGSTKSLSGHALGAAGVHEAIYCLIMLQKGFLAESAHITDLCEEGEAVNILRKRKDEQPKRVMSNSFGFGGTNACLIMDQPEE